MRSDAMRRRNLPRKTRLASQNLPSMHFIPLTQAHCSDTSLQAKILSVIRQMGQPPQDSRVKYDANRNQHGREGEVALRLLWYPAKNWAAGILLGGSTVGRVGGYGLKIGWWG
jgi:hypothetical protein